MTTSLAMSRRSLFGAACLALGTTPARAAEYVAPFTRENQLTTDVLIEGKGPFRFAVDTGAERTVLAEDVAASLGLPRERRVVVEGVVCSVVAETVGVHALSMGSVTRQGLHLPLLPRSLLHVDGYLGLDAIDGSRVEFDFRQRSVAVTRPRPAFRWELVRRPGETRIPASGRYGHLQAMGCSVDGVAAVAFIDSGAEVTSGNRPLLDALARRDPSYRVTETMKLSGITGGALEARLTQIKKIKLFDFEITNCPLAVADLQVFGIWGLADIPALMVGINVLRAFTMVSIDYGCQEFRLELASLRVAQRT